MLEVVITVQRAVNIYLEADASVFLAMQASSENVSSFRQLTSNGLVEPTHDLF